MVKLYNLARVSTATTGTGTITLGSAVAGFRSFADAGVSNGEVVRYSIRDGLNSEMGSGTYSSSGPTLTRSVISSTNSNSAINLSGSAEVAIAPAAVDIVRTVASNSPDSDGNVSLTKSSVGLGNVDNTADADKPVSSATATELSLKVSYSDLGNVSTSGGGAALVGVKHSASSTVGRALSNVLDDFLTVKDFGAVGDNSTNDLTAIQAAYTSSVSSGLPIVFPPGKYVINGTWTISNGGIKVVALGDVTIRHTGSGIAVAIDGGSLSGQNIFDIEFGKNSPINIVGNASTTKGLHIRGAHHLDVDVDVRECAHPCYVEFTVLSRINVRCSYFDGAFTTQPTTVLYIDKRQTNEIPSANEFFVIAEGSASYGVDIVECTMSRFTGTSEGNDSGGLRARAGAYRNSFYDMDNEDNGSSPDWFIEGNDNVFENCLGDITSTSLLVTGDRNRFVTGYYGVLTIDSSAAYTMLEEVEYQSLTDGSSTTFVSRCHTGSTLQPAKDPHPAPLVMSGVGPSSVTAGNYYFFTAGVSSVDFYQACGVMPFDAVITKIQVYTQAAPGSGQTHTGTFFINNASTALTFTISAGNTGSATGSVAIAAGDRFALKMEASASAASTGPIAFGIEYRVKTWS